MKKAIGYVRISNKDQSHFSLDYQEKLINEWAIRHQVELVSIYKDEGQSAKNFDRSDWRLLEKFCEANKSVIDYLVVPKFDRFSRNLKDALDMLELLEEKYKIKVESTSEFYGDRSSPNFFIQRATLLLGAEAEWRNIQYRTKCGINQGQQSGRYMSKAPYGYRNARDEQNRPKLVSVEEELIVIRRMFQMHLEGASFKEIKSEARRNGFRKKYKSAVREVLMNPVYGGLIKVSPVMDEPEKLVKGNHEAAIPEEVWHRVQAGFASKGKANRTVMNENVPLRSVIRCVHGNLMTAGESVGKNKKMSYWYYKSPCCPKINLSAIKLHDKMDELLKQLSLPDHYVIYLKEAIEKELEATRKEMSLGFDSKTREIAALKIKIENNEEKYINDGFPKEDYLKWKERYERELRLAEAYLQETSKPVAEMMKLINQQLPMLSNLHFLWHQAELHAKQAILRTVFNSQLYFANGSYRTPYILPAFRTRASLLNDLGLLVYEPPQLVAPEMCESTPQQASIEHLIPLLNIIKSIKVA